MASPTILLTGATVLQHDDQDHVQALRDTDILLEANKIKQIGKGLSAPADAEVVDCRGKIISPGFVDTHHHLWQTQLKGRHADHSIFNYLFHGFWQSHVYKPEDMFWGQLGGAMEAIHTGTTFVLDHAHGGRTDDHVRQSLAGTCTSGIRSIFAFAHAPYFVKWDSEVCELSRDIMPESSMTLLKQLADMQPFSKGKVTIGFGFDYWFLPKEAVVGTFEGLRAAGVKLFTTHAPKNAVLGQSSRINTLIEYNLLKSPSDILLSHATGLDAQEKELLAQTQVPVSSTPDTEAQMGFGWPIAFSPGINYSFGVDCHSNNTSSILQLARSALQMARQKAALPLIEKGQSPLGLRGSTEEAFNAATIQGARAVQLGDQIGSIKEGKFADLVIFDTLDSPGMSCVAESDPLTAVLRHSEVSDVEGVIIDGFWRKRAGKLTPVPQKTGELLSWEQVRTELERSRKEIAEREKSLNMEKAKESLTMMFGIDPKILVDQE